MKKFLAIAATFVAMTGAAFAQGESATSGSITATGTVIVPLTIGSLHNLTLPTNMARGYNTTLLASDANAASATVTGDADDYITITWGDNAGTGSQMTMSLTNPQVAAGVNATAATQNTFVVTLDPYWGPDQANLTHYTGTHVQLHNNIAAGNGSQNFYFAATPSVSATQQRGNYSGSFTIVANYSN